MAAFDTNQVLYAGIPFCLDKVVPLRQRLADRAKLTDGDRRPPMPETPEVNLIDHLNWLLAPKFLQDYMPPGQYGGRNIGNVAVPWVTETPNRTVSIGEWFYPLDAARWSVFRGLATSSMVKAMVAAALTPQATPQTLTITCPPISPDNPNADPSNYTVSSPMYLMPPRPLSEHPGCEGLYLVTLVDERWYWQFKPATLRVYADTEWLDILSDLGAALGISVTGVVDPIFLRPEADSPLWANAESAPQLLDAVAANLGLTCVRPLAGGIELMDNQTSYNRVVANRGPQETLIRFAGGDMFYSGGKLPVGSLINAKEAVCPAVIRVTFPQYVQGDDPVPHLVNTRYENQRPSTWYEDSYGSVYNEDVPILSGDTIYAPGGSILSGVTGIGTYTLHTTAKALYSTVSGALNPLTLPDNVGALRDLAVGLVQDYYASQATWALDESYPGIFNWAPEGFHDIVWTHSATLKQATTRVMRPEWNCVIREFSHATPPAGASQTNHPKGVGGLSVAQTIRDEYNFSAAALLCSGIGVTSLTADFTTVAGLPTQDRWRGYIGSEAILFDGTSGGLPSPYSGYVVTIARRGIDSTIAVAHTAGEGISWTLENCTYGVNLPTFARGFLALPGEWTDTGIQEAKILCPLRTVQAFSATPDLSGFAMGVPFFSGQVLDASPAGGYGGDRLVWLYERNLNPLVSGKYYAGQLAGFSQSGSTAPVYFVSEGGGENLPTVRDQYSVTTAYTAQGSVASGDLVADISPIDYLPTQNRWLGTLETEQILFNGTSGGLPGGVTIAQRGVNNTTQTFHPAGAAGSWSVPDAVSGVVQTTYAKGFFVHPGSYSGIINSGNLSGQYVREAVLLCPTRTVQVLSASGVFINGVDSFSGRVCDFNPVTVSGSQFPTDTLIWVQDRNGVCLRSGQRYDGQLVGYPASGLSGGHTAPLYVVSDRPRQPDVRDRWGVTGTYGLTGDLLSGGMVANLNHVSYLPVSERWIGTVESERILFEGTGGVTNVNIAQRGVDSTAQVFHAGGSPGTWIVPDIARNVEMTTFAEGFLVQQGSFSGWAGNTVREAVVMCPLRTVYVPDASGYTILNGIISYPGTATNTATTGVSGSQFPAQTTVWVQDRNGTPLSSGHYYGGQLAGYAISGDFPVYVTNTDADDGDKWNLRQTIVTLSGTYNPWNMPTTPRVIAYCQFPVRILSIVVQLRAKREVLNGGPGNIYWANDSTSSATPSEHISTPDGTDWEQRPGETFTMEYPTE